MATTIVSTNTGANQTVNAGDLFILTEGTYLSGSIEDGAVAGTDELHVNLNGQMYDYLYLDSYAFSKHVLIGPYGLFQHKASGGGVSMSFRNSDGSSLTNQGHVDSGIIEISDGIGFVFTNTGVMTQASGYYGINELFSIYNVYDFYAANLGTISTHGTTFRMDGSSSGAEFQNSGIITSGTTIFDTQGYIDVLNTGDLITQGSILLADSSVVFENTGQLVSGSVVIHSDGGFTEFRNSGTVSSNGFLIDAVSTVYAQNSGSINAEVGVYSTSGALVIENSGSFTTRNGELVEGPYLFVNNTGDMIANSTIGLRYGDSGSLMNEGNIQAYSVAVFVAGNGNRLVNSGAIQGSTGLYLFEGSSNDIINSGEISSFDGAGIRGVSEGTFRLVNSGTIFGNAIAGISMESMGGSAIIKNSGVVSSADGVALRISNGVDVYDHTVVNSGQLIGDVFLSNGNDVYNGRAGFVSGTIDGGEGDDIITGGEAADVIDGGAGANEIRSLGGDDVIVTGDDVDFIVSGAGDDDITSGNGDDTIRGGEGEDQINGQGGVDFIQGGGGNDYIRMGNGDGQRGEGNAGDDYIAGGNQKDVLLGGADEDELLGQGGDDVLRGGTGDDVLEGGTGNDRIIGNAGEDTAVFSGALSDYTIVLNGNGTVDVTDLVGTDGVDNLFGIELVEFTDGTYLLSDFI